MKMPARTLQIQGVIHTIRGEKVILDSDLARLYSVPVKRLNEQFRRNRHKFPADFAFQITEAEWESLRSQNATLKLGRGLHRKYLPFVFTEHGALQAANILNSKKAAAMSIYVIRAFVKMRGALSNREDLASKLTTLETEVKTRFNLHESAIVDVLQRIMNILDPPPEPEPPRPQIGFHVKPEQEHKPKGRRK
jgi:hypothetical protein